MSESKNPTNDLLAFRAMPELGAALRACRERVLQRWAALADELIPKADELTTRQVRDTIPILLTYLADALDSSRPFEAEELARLCMQHGVSRFHQSYDVKSLIIEYRLLRRLVKDHVAEILGPLRMEQLLALDIGVGIVLQQGVVAFTDH